MPKYIKSQTKVMIAFLAFMGFISTILLAMFLRQLPQPEEAQQVTNQAKTSSTEVFYQSIGTTVIAEPGQSPEQRLESFQQAFAVEFLLTPQKSVAQDMVQKLLKSGIQAYYMPIHRDGIVLYRVRSAVFSSKEQAEQLAKNMGPAQNVATKVMPL